MTAGPSVPEFGRREAGRAYLSRPGAYALLQDIAGRLAVVRTPAGIFLPGGGIEGNETAELALRREVAEECGLVAEIGAYLGQADEYLYSPTYQEYYVKHCHFYLAKAVGTTQATEVDHELLWLPVDEVRRELQQDSQQWAIARATTGHEGP